MTRVFRTQFRATQTYCSWRQARSVGGLVRKRTAVGDGRGRSISWYANVLLLAMGAGAQFRGTQTYCSWRWASSVGGLVRKRTALGDGRERSVPRYANVPLLATGASAQFRATQTHCSRRRAWSVGGSVRKRTALGDGAERRRLGAQTYCSRRRAWSSVRKRTALGDRRGASGPGTQAYCRAFVSSCARLQNGSREGRAPKQARSNPWPQPDAEGCAGPRALRDHQSQASTPAIACDWD